MVYVRLMSWVLFMWKNCLDGKMAETFVMLKYLLHFAVEITEKKDILAALLEH